MSAKSSHFADELQRRSAAGGRTRRPVGTAQAVARAEDWLARDGEWAHWRPYVYLAAGLSFAAAQIHAWIMPEHLAEQPAEGLFFLLVAFAQGAYAAALLGRPRSAPLLAAGLGVTVGLLLLLVAAHTVGLPLVVPHAHVHGHGLAEAFDPAARATLVVEGGLVLVLAALLRAQAAAKRAH